MAPPLLFFKHGGGAPAVFRYIGATAAQVGNTFGTTDGVENGRWQPRGRVIQAKNRLYVAAHDGVYRLQGDGVTWSSALIDGGLPFSSPDLTDLRTRSGLHLVYIGTVPHLAGWYLDSTSSSHLRGYKLNLNTDVWIEFAAVNTGVALDGIVGGSPHNEIVYRNVLHFSTGRNAGADIDLRTFDPATGSFAIITSAWAGVDIFFGDFCIHNDRLFLLASPLSTAAGSLTLYEFTGGTWNTVVTVIEPGVPSTNYGVSGRFVRNCLFTDGTNLFALVLLDITGAAVFSWRVYKILLSPLTITNITATVVPVALRDPVEGGAFVQAGTSRFFKFVDVDTLPGTATVYLYQAPDALVATPLTLYRWNGDAAVMTQIDVGGDVNHNWPSQGQTGGERVWTAGELDIIIVNRTPVPGGEKLHYRAFGDPGPDDKFVRFYFNREGEPVISQCTLAGAATGGISTRVGNQIEDVDADNGVTEYTAIWDITADGVATGDRVQVIPRVSIS